MTTPTLEIRIHPTDLKNYNKGMFDYGRPVAGTMLSSGIHLISDKDVKRGTARIRVLR